MSQSPSEAEKWACFRDLSTGREVKAAPQGDFWIVRDGVITRRVEADDFAERYEAA
jgi:hypothetical protein